VCVGVNGVYNASSLKIEISQNNKIAKYGSKYLLYITGN